LDKPWITLHAAMEPELNSALHYHSGQPGHCDEFATLHTRPPGAYA